jgi:hypothetical protein
VPVIKIKEDKIKVNYNEQYRKRWEGTSTTLGFSSGPTKDFYL